MPHLTPKSRDYLGYIQFYTLFWNLTTAAPPIIFSETSKVISKISLYDLMTICRVLPLIIGQNHINSKLLQPIVASICKVMTVKKPCVWLPVIIVTQVLPANAAGEITFCELVVLPLLEMLSSSDAEPPPPPVEDPEGRSWWILRLALPVELPPEPLPLLLPSIWISVVMLDTWPLCGLLLLSLRWKKLPPVLLLDLLLPRKDRC